MKGSRMIKAKSGDTVKVRYTGKLDNGRVFDASGNRAPLKLIIGENKVIPAFEQAIIGMQPGESKTINIPADEAFGPYHEELVRMVDRSTFSPNLEPKVGQRLKATCADGRSISVTVTEVSESAVTIDANHLLAGENLTFDIELIEVV
jgi:peptidylprolyl isomerase